MIKFLSRIVLFGLIAMGGLLAWEYNSQQSNSDNPQSFTEFFSSVLKKEIGEIRDDLTTEGKTADFAGTEEETEEKTSFAPGEDIPENYFKTLDDHASSATYLDEEDVPTLATYLAQEAETDLEKARAIYVWVAKNVAYDDVAYNTKEYENYTPEYVLEHRKAVCAGFANMFTALGDEMGLEVKTVSGYSKGYSYNVGKKFKDSDHAWNAVNIDGEWSIFDATWGGGSGKTVNGKLVSEKKFNTVWFNVDPYAAIFSHFPKNEELSFVIPSITLEDYEKMPKISGQYFDIGFDAKETYKQVYLNKKFEAPEMYGTSVKIKMLEAPPTKNLVLNKTYDFEFHIPEGRKMAIVKSKKDWTHFKKENGNFVLRYTPKKTGKISVNVNTKKGSNSFETIMAYNVKRK